MDSRFINSHGIETLRHGDASYFMAQFMKCCSITWIDFLTKIVSNISYTRSVSSDIRTQRRELKNEAIYEFFNQLQGVWISDETRLLSV